MSPELPLFVPPSRFSRRALSDETKMKMRRARAEEAGSRATGSGPGSTWSTSRKGLTGAAAAARQSSGTWPHICTLTTVMAGSPATGLRSAPVSTTPPWPSPWPRPRPKHRRKRTRTMRTTRTGRRGRETGRVWDHLSTLRPRTATSSSPPRQRMGVGRRGTGVLPVHSCSR